MPTNIARRAVSRCLREVDVYDSHFIDTLGLGRRRAGWWKTR
jgi:hypothetical protein